MACTPAPNRLCTTPPIGWCLHQDSSADGVAGCAERSGTVSAEYVCVVRKQQIYKFAEHGILAKSLAVTGCMSCL